MALTTRQVTNSGAPLYSPSGALLANVTITFTLVDAIGNQTDAFDIITGERVMSVVQTTTDANGIFSVNLWPNDRGDKVTKYLCRVIGLPGQDFAAQVPTGAGYLSWLNFKTSGAILTPAQVLALDAHIADATLHLSAAQNTLLDAVDPTLTGAEVNFIKGSKSPIQADVVTVTATHTAANTEETILVDATLASFVVTLPTAASNPKKKFVFKKINATNSVTVQAAGVETIDGANTQILTTQWSILRIQSNGTAWFIV